MPVRTYSMYARDFSISPDDGDYMYQCSSAKKTTIVATAAARDRLAQLVALVEC